MSVFNFEKLFEPKSVCIVREKGIDDPVLTAIEMHLQKGSFDGCVSTLSYHPPKRFSPFMGKSCERGVLSTTDLVVATACGSNLLPLIEESAESGVGAMILTGFWDKTDRTENLKIAGRVRQLVEQTGMRILGPDTNGMISCGVRMNCSTIGDMPLPGRIALLSQSGSIGASILDLSHKKKMGFSYYVGLGAMMDVEFGDLIDYLGGDPRVSSIVMYAENLVRFRNFMSAARKVSRIKPIIALKSGRTPGGAKAAAAHTGEGAGNDRVYDEAFKRAGIVRVRTFEELFDCAELLAKRQRPSSPGLAIITNAGGPGVMAADALYDYGAHPAPLNPELVSRLDQILPRAWSRNNPIDILGDADPHRYRHVIDVCRTAADIHAFLIIHAPHTHGGSDRVAEALTELMKENPPIIFVSWMGGDRVETSCDILNKAGIPTFDTPERAVRAFMDLFRHAENLHMLQQIPSQFPYKPAFDRTRAHEIIQRATKEGPRWLSPRDAADLLDAYGIRANEGINPSGVDQAPPLDDTKPTGAPTRADDDPAALFQQQKIAMCLGAVTDQYFGPVLFLAHENGAMENLNACAVSLPPLNRLLARRLIENSDLYAVLQCHPCFTHAHFSYLENLLTRISQLVTDFSEIDTLVINPYHLCHDAAAAGECRLHVSPSTVPAPMHLVISAYPNQYEDAVTLNKVGRLTIRPIKPEDAPLLSDLFDSLSPQTIYFRFFTPMKSLPHSMLARFTQIDYDREIALVAIQESPPAEKMLGVSRVITERDATKAEFAILVSDSCQGKGIGAELLKRCLSMSKERGIREVYGTVLAENTTMLALGKKLGFEIASGADGREYELRIDLARDERENRRISNKK